MDFVQEWLEILTATLSASQLKAVYSVMSTLRALFLSLTAYVSTTSPSLATIALTLIILFVSLKVLGMLWRAVVFWLRLAVRVAFWAALMVVAAWLYSRGPEGVVEDVRGALVHWQGRYEYYRLQAEAQGALKRGRGGAGTRGYDRPWW